MGINYFLRSQYPGAIDAHKIPKLLAKAESYLLESLEIKERFPSAKIDLAEVFFYLGKIYALKADFYLGKKEFKKALEFRLAYK